MACPDRAGWLPPQSIILGFAPGGLTAAAPFWAL
jgi:hypothetical protein